MIDIDEQLSVALERRAETAVVRDDLEAILTGTNVIRFSDPAVSAGRRPQLLLVAAAGLVAVTGGLVWAQTVRNEPAANSQQPTQPEESMSLPDVDVDAPAPWALPVSPNPDRIDAFPIVDDLPASAYANFSTRTDENTWIGAIGTLQLDGVPQPLVAVAAFANGQDPFPEAVPGRIAGVSEISFGGGRATLAWSVDDTPLTLAGADLDTMYSLVEHIVPSADGADRSGYVIVGELPSGLVELEAPHELKPMNFPAINSETGEFGVSVDDGPFLSVLAATGVADREPITINSLDGFISADDQPLIALALSGDEIMFVSSSTMTRDQLVDFAGTIRIGDEAEFRSVYGVTD